MEVAYCPRCDRAFNKTAERSALWRVSDHMDRAHPDMQNYIKEELLEEEENVGD